jgi:guanylate kinase
VKNGLLIVLSGPSGVGKGTILKEVTKLVPSLALSVSATTRKPRSGEIEGNNYFFKTKEQFSNMIKNNEFLEYAEVVGNLYGTPKKAVIEKLEKGIDVVLEIDVKGAINIHNNFNEAVMIFILPPSKEELFKRLRERGTETEEELGLRMELASQELMLCDRYNYLVVNDKLEDAIMDVASIIRSHKCLTVNNKQIISLIQGGKY